MIFRKKDLNQSCLLYSVHGRGADLPLNCVLAMIQYWYRLIFNIVMHCATLRSRVIYLTQTLLYVEQHTEKQLGPFLKS